MKPHILVIGLALLGPATWAAADAPIDTPANTAASPGDEVPGPFLGEVAAGHSAFRGELERIIHHHRQGIEQLSIAAL